MALTEEQAKEMLAQLREHYHEPVMPISKYCAAFYKWREAIRDGAERELKEGVPEAHRILIHKIQRIDAVSVDVSKSNLLNRLLYIGEDLRTEMCPEHKGHWSGCTWKDDCGCLSGCNITGWLAPKS